MKSKEQLELATNLIKKLQDYVELAKVEKKLKDTKTITNFSKQLEDLTFDIIENTENL